LPAILLPDVFTTQLVYQLTLLVLTALVLLTLASQFGKHLYFELTTHFRLQYILGALLCTIVLTAFQSWKFVPIAIFCAALNLVYVVPYYRDYRAKAQPAKTQPKQSLRLLQANVLKVNKNYNAVLEVVHKTKADVVVLQEFTHDWNTQTKSLEQEYPYFVSESRPSGSGMAVFSRYPFEETRTLILDESTHVAILARVSFNGNPISVLALHPTTPITALKFKNRNRQFREAAALMKDISGTKLIIGDLNITMWSPYFVDLISSSSLRDARLGFGLRTSWPNPLPSFLRLPIDHCLVGNDVQVDNIQTGESIGSDHRPLIIDLSL